MRHELKYILTPVQYHRLSPMLSALMERDEHADENGEYFIRSIYFDDDRMKAFWDKLNGVDYRKKYRIRFYNNDLSYINLECKIKRGGRIEKEAERIDEGILRALLNGDNHNHNGGDTGELSRKIFSNGLKPAVIVDYVREAYTLPYDDIRITFDKDIAYGQDFESINCPRIFSNIMGDNVVLEVKYNEFLPEHISSVISSVSPVQCAASKYVMCISRGINDTVGSLDFVNSTVA